MLQWQSGSWILGSTSAPKVLGIYGLGITLGTYYGTFSTAISSVFLPRATQMSVNNASGKELTDMMVKLGRLSFIILMYVFGAFLMYGEQFINLWVGAGDTNNTERFSSSECYQIFLISIFVMIGYTTPLLQAFGNSILEAKNKVSFKAVLYLIFMLIGAVVGGFLSEKYGALGMVGSLVGAWLIVQNVMNFYYNYKIKLHIVYFFKEVFNKTIIAVLISFAIGYSIKYTPGLGWFNFIIKGILYSIAYISLAFLIGMKPYEKDLFIKPINAFLNKK